jgi:glycine hydroxymethyltransferase
MCNEDRAKDLDRVVFPGVQGGPLMHVIAAKAVCLAEALQPAFADYQKQIVANAAALAARLAENGLRIVSGGTDTHLLLVDLRPFGLTGKVAEKRLEEASITVNKNTIPFDPQKPFVTSGIRLGTPALTTRGMKEPEMRAIGDMIARVLKDIENDDVVARVRPEVGELCERFPLYAEMKARYIAEAKKRGMNA